MGRSALKSIAKVLHFFDICKSMMRFFYLKHTWHQKKEQNLKKALARKLKIYEDVILKYEFAEF